MSIDHWDWGISGQRYCYVRRDLIYRLLGYQIHLRRLASLLRLEMRPSKLQKLSHEALSDAVWEHTSQISRQKHSRWFDVDPMEIIAATMFLHRKSPASRQWSKIYFPVNRESELNGAASSYLSMSGATPIDELRMGEKKIDWVGIKPGGFWSSVRVVGLELKNSLYDLERGIHQLAVFREYTDDLSIVCTPELAAEYIARHCKMGIRDHWEEDAFERRLRQMGVGLMLAEGDQTFEILQPVSGSTIPAKRDLAIAEIERRIDLENKRVRRNK